VRVIDLESFGIFQFGRKQRLQRSIPLKKIRFELGMVTVSGKKRQAAGEDWRAEES